jgi:hypothetical protein
MAEAIYILCALTSIACAVLLLRGYRSSRTRLLFWSSLCFWGLAANNVLLVLDLVITGPETNLQIFRNVAGVLAISTMLYGLVWESK